MKIIGVGLNKTGTKTLRYYLQQWGFRHQSYDFALFQQYLRGEIQALLESMDPYDSFEDWPWPLIFREIDAHIADARFVLTTRKSPEIWYRSLCNMAVRMGPFTDYEKHIYGYAMPQGHRDEHIRYYLRHNRAVEDHFRKRPGKLLKLCWEAGDDASRLAEFLNLQVPEIAPVTVNRSSRRVYSGDSLILAHANRIAYQCWWNAATRTRQAGRFLRRHLQRRR